MNDRPTRQLYEQRGKTSRFIHATVEPNGDLVLSGQDLGDGPQQFWGDDEYEFWVTVSAEHKDAVLLALLEARFGGDPAAVDTFRAFLTEYGIPGKFETWT